MTITILRASGHPQAGRYPMGRVFIESWLVRRMMRKNLAAAAIVFNMAVASMFDKKGGDSAKAFRKFTTEA